MQYRGVKIKKYPFFSTFQGQCMELEIPPPFLRVFRNEHESNDFVLSSVTRNSISTTNSLTELFHWDLLLLKRLDIIQAGTTKEKQSIAMLLDLL